MNGSDSSELPPSNNERYVRPGGSNGSLSLTLSRLSYYSPWCWATPRQ
jgi:hypothetical protein